MTPTTVWISAGGVESLCYMLEMMSPRRSDDILCRGIKGCNIMVSYFVTYLKHSCKIYENDRRVLLNKIEQIRVNLVLQVVQNDLK